MVKRFRRNEEDLMAESVYECMFILDTGKVGGDVTVAEKQLNAIFAKNQAEVLASRPWDERRLAYPIAKHKKGLYYLTYFRTETKNITGIEHDCSLNEMILRKLILRVDPKLVDTMLALAREGHAAALHNVTQEPEDQFGEDIGAMEGRPRRRRNEGEKD
jgi:small subunit ribosomal protein S6